MSSPVNRRSHRSSLASTPMRSNRPSSQAPPSPTPQLPAEVMSSPNRPSQSTPRGPRQTVASSSPLFFRSSPATGSAVVNGDSRMEIRSPLSQASSIADNDVTPRGRAQPPNGILIPNIVYQTTADGDYPNRLFPYPLCF